MNGTSSRLAESPAVSVIITCHNLGRFLDEAIRSVLSQSYQDFEILIVDDGSDDPDTSRLLASYSRPKTRIVRTENRGLSAARNHGLAHTTGRYVSMLDADDCLEPDMLARSVAALDTDDSLTFVSHWLRYFGDESGEWCPTDCGFPALLDQNTVNGAALVRRSALLAVGGFDESMREGCEDWDLWITLVEQGCRGAIIPRVLFNYRRRADSMSRVMRQGDTHSRIYSYLATKHHTSFSAHVGALVARRERDWSHLLCHTYDLELEYRHLLQPQLGQLRDELARLERCVSRRQDQRTSPEVQRLHDMEKSRLEEEVRALRTSVSWRITAPLRRAFDVLRRAMGQQP